MKNKKIRKQNRIFLFFEEETTIYKEK